MTTRQEQLLKHIVENYTETAEPVGSKYLVEKQGLDLSSATIRSEMAKMEEMGIIMQPHTSAGRIPTLKGFHYYIDSIMEPHHLSMKDIQRFRQILDNSSIKDVAKATADYCNAAVVVAHDAQDYYYTGFSYLFSQPEFNNSNIIHAISSAIDKIEEAIPHFIDHTEDSQVKIFLGNDNPLGDHCSIVCTRKSKNDTTQFFGILAPIRTHYAKNVALLNFLLMNS